MFGKSTRGKRLKSDDRIAGDLPFVTAGEADTGVSAYIGNDVDVFESNTTTIDMFGSAKYRNYRYGGDDHIAVVHTESLPLLAAIFVTVAINKSSHCGQFDYSRNFYAKDADELYIKLPTKNGAIDFDFMENFIAELEAQRIAELEAYLSATGLKDYELTADDKLALDELPTKKWAEFAIGSLFDKLELKSKKGKTFDKAKDVSRIKTAEYSLPLVNAKSGDNGIMYYGRETDFEGAEMTIDIVGNGAVATGDVYPQPQLTGVLWDAYLIKSNYCATAELLYFFATSIYKSIKLQFGYEYKAVWDRVKKEKIKLPLDANLQIDFEYMQHLMTSIQKLVIKDVVTYADRKIALTKEVC